MARHERLAVDLSVLAIEHLDALQHAFGIGAAVCLDDGSDDVDAFGLHLMGAVQHGVGLAASRRGTEVDGKAPVTDAQPVASCVSVGVSRAQTSAGFVHLEML